MKLPFSFATRLVFRLVLPGLVSTVALFPVIRYVQVCVAADVGTKALLPFTVVFLGWLINLLDMPIYQIFEGRRFWPHWLRGPLTERLSNRLRYLQAEVARRRGRGQHILAAEVEILTTDFPLTSDGNRVAKYPTRLGNIITEYEEYSTRKYEADGVFYWSRVWWKMPKEVRDALEPLAPCSSPVR